MDDVPTLGLWPNPGMPVSYNAYMQLKLAVLCPCEFFPPSINEVEE